MEWQCSHVRALCCCIEYCTTNRLHRALPAESGKSEVLNPRQHLVSVHRLEITKQNQTNTGTMATAGGPLFAMPSVATTGLVHYDEHDNGDESSILSGQMDFGLTVTVGVGVGVGSFLFHSELRRGTLLFRVKCPKQDSDIESWLRKLYICRTFTVISFLLPL